jgi:hypothetical protein
MTRKSVFDGHIARRSQSTQSFSTGFIALRFLCTVFAVAILNCASSAFAHAAPAPSPQPSTAAAASSAQAQLDENYGKVPLSFEPNQGQSASGAQFLARGSGYTLLLSPERVTLELKLRQQPASPSPNPTQSDTVNMQLLGSTGAASGAGLEPLPGVVNYFIGNDPGKWRTGIATYRKVNFAEVYPAIDLVFYGNQRQLEYDFIVKPGGEPASIAWSVSGARPHLGEDGSLELSAPGGPVRFLAPVAYQVIDGRRKPVSASYAVAEQTVHFALGSYDHSRALIIDPVLSYFSYLGGTGNDYIGNANPGAVGSAGPEPTQAVGIDSLRNLYVVGSTTSTDFPVASPLLPKTTKTNTSETWAFISKFSPDGSHLLYSTYLGGSTGGNDAVYSLAVDATGNVYATGTAGTNDFPVTAGAFQTLCAPARDNNTGNAVAACTFNTGSGSYTQNAFALKLNPTGSSLLYSSFLGGIGAAWGTGIAVDSAGQAYITGTETATLCGGAVFQYGAQYECFPTTANAVISDIGGGNPIDMAFMSVFNATGSSLVYSTLFGDSQGGVSVKGGGCSADCGAITHGTSIALDPSGNVYIGGMTVAANMVTTAGAFNTFGSGPIATSPQILVSPNGYGYVAKFAPVTASGTSLIYSTYFGGGAVYGGDVGGLAADSTGNVYITGDTHAADFPATAGAYQTTCDPNQLPTWCGAGSYVAKLNPTGTALVWATYLGNGSNAPLYFLGPVILDGAGDVYVLGEGAGKLPLGGGNLSALNGNPTAYVAKFNSTGSQVLFGATVGGPGNGQEWAGGMAVDSAGAVYVGGTIGPGGGPFSTPGAFQQAYAGGNFDAFVAKVLQTQLSTTTLTISPASPTVGQQVTLTAKVTGPSGSTVVPTGTVTFLSSSSTLGTGKLDGTGTATYSTSSLNATTYTLTASYGGDSAYSASTSSAQSLVVTPDLTTTTLTVSPASTTAGQTITFTAKVKVNTGSTIPTGTITFLNGTKQIAAVAVDGAGTATFTSSTLAVGTYSVTAAYSGDANNASSTSSATTLVVSTAPVATTTTLTASATTVTSGASITFTATVKPASGSVAATGTVTFKDGSTTLGTGTLDGTGKATYGTAALSVGSHSITASYGGDSGNLTSTSSAVSITVSAPPPADFTLSIAPSSGSVSAGTPATVTVTVTPVNGFNAATTFACSGLPANSTCGFSPATVTPNGTAASTTTMTIDSNVKAAAAFAGGSLSLLILPMVAWRNRRRRGLVALCIPVVLLALATVGISACASNGGGSKTPAGTYTVTVTAASGTLNHNATYSFTVK